MNIDTFAIIGGDERCARLCSLLAADGYTVFSAGHELAHEFVGTAICTDALTAAAMSQAVIFPVPMLSGEAINAPLSTRTILPCDELLSNVRRARVFGGMLPERFIRLGWHDYATDEQFLILNARLTAEAALAEIITATPGALYGSDCLITGYGRIARILAPILQALGCRVSAAARRPADRAFITAAGMEALPFERIGERAYRYAAVINTVPAAVLGQEFLSKLDRSALVLDLASRPGGVDFQAAERLGIKTIHALSLPGRVSPLAAAAIIRDTVLSGIREE